MKPLMPDNQYTLLRPMYKTLRAWVDLTGHRPHDEVIGVFEFGLRCREKRTHTIGQKWTVELITPWGWFKLIAVTNLRFRSRQMDAIGNTSVDLQWRC